MKHSNTTTETGHISVDTFHHEETDRSAVWITMHADSLDLEQETRTLTRDDGHKFKVKIITAYDEEGNEVKLRIIFDK